MPETPSVSAAPKPKTRRSRKAAGAPPKPVSAAAKPKTQAGAPPASLDVLEPTSPAAKPVALAPTTGNGSLQATEFVPWANSATPSASSIQEIPLAGRVLKAGAPLELEGIDPNRPVAYVAVQTKSGGKVTVRVGRDVQQNRLDGSADNWGFKQPTYGPVFLEGQGELVSASVFYADEQNQGFADYYSLPLGRDGIRHGETLCFPIPPQREGMEISNIDVSFHAPVREWNAETDRELRPTYAIWQMDDRQIGRKFVDPNEDAGNIPEIDNVHPANANDAGVLCRAGKELRITAQNTDIPGDETAMTVQWVRISYRPKGTEIQSFSFKGKSLANSEWEGKWIQPGQSLVLEVDPTKRIARVEVQWSDKPDDVDYNSPGKWATGSLRLDGQPLGNQREHVGSPEWQIFDHLKGVQGKRLEVRAEGCPLKVFELKIFYVN